MIKTRSNEQWGHPVGVRAAASWSLCPELTLPTGVAGTTCQGATCMVVCDEGKVAIGKRRVKCRWNRKKGFFWKTVRPYLIFLSTKQVIIGDFRHYLNAKVAHLIHLNQTIRI